MQKYYIKPDGREASYFKEGFVEIINPVREDGTLLPKHKNLHLVADITQKYHKLTIDATSGLYEPDTVKNETETLELAVQGFTKKTTEFIQARVDEYNLANGTAFTNVHNCESYSRTTGYTHQAWCLEVWTWNVAVWEAVRALATIPTDTEFQAVLDGVTF